jgi:transcriptional regulator with XRE-family HTH domain
MLGKNIKELRQKRKLSQEKLARLTNISLNTLTKIESGFTKRPSIQTIHKIAKALGISLDKLVEDETR